jgi:hypothetical protein
VVRLGRGRDAEPAPARVAPDVDAFVAVLTMNGLPPVRREIWSPWRMFASVQSLCVTFSMKPRTLWIPM